MKRNVVMFFLYISLSSLLKYPLLPTEANNRELQVAHGLILRCFVKRWVGLEVNSSLELDLETGAMAVVRYASFPKAVS